MDDAGESAAAAVRFGRTLIQPAAGDVTEQPVEAIVFAANRTGIMGAGPVGPARAGAGPEVEREAMEQAPLEMGSAIATSSGGLSRLGIETILHAVVAERLSAAAELGDIRLALDAALRLADERRLHSLALPLLGVRPSATLPERTTLIETMIGELVAHLRRGGSRLERVVIVSRFTDDLPFIQEALERARQRVWAVGP